MGIIDLKHIHCMDDKGKGCGLLFTAPKECNDNKDFIHHAQIMHVKAPQVIDKKGNLRPMTKDELSDHEDQVNNAVKIHLKAYQKKYPKNKFNVVQLDDTDTHFVHEFQVEKVEGIYKKTQEDEEITRRLVNTTDEFDTFEAIVKTTTTHIVSCQCGKEGYSTYFETFSKKQFQITKPQKPKARKKSQV